MFLPSYCFNGSQVTGTGGPIDPPGPEKQGSPNIFWAFFLIFSMFLWEFSHNKKLSGFQENLHFLHLW